MAQDHVLPASAPEGVGGQKLADAADNLSQEGASPQQRRVYIYIYTCMYVQETTHARVIHVKFNANIA